MSQTQQPIKPADQDAVEPRTATEPRWSWRLHDDLPGPSLTSLFLIALSLGLAPHTHSQMYMNMGAQIMLLVFSIGSLVSARGAKNYWLVYFSTLLTTTALYPFFVYLVGAPNFFSAS